MQSRAERVGTASVIGRLRLSGQRGISAVNLLKHLNWKTRQKSAKRDKERHARAETAVLRTGKTTQRALLQLRAALDAELRVAARNLKCEV